MKTTTLFSSLFVAIFVLITACNSEKKETPQDVSPIPKEVVKPSEDVVFVLDVSASMLAQDFVPNRLEAVKNMLKKMIAERELQQRMSIILFAGEGFILCPLTKDSTALMEKVDLIQADRMDEGTAIGLGMMLGLYELSKSKSAQKDMIVLTDGVNNMGEYAPSFAAQIATQQNIQIHSFGVGCTGTALSPIAKRPDNTFVFGNTPVEIDEEILKAIGEQTQGNYLRVTCSSDLENLQYLNCLMDHSNPTPMPNKLDTFPAEVLDSFWNALYLKDKITLKNFNTLE
ncbi:MAG: Ca-activated chloride channel family protein [Aureispira sp.]|jgi:Ca-activated chloride channel family protein